MRGKTILIYGNTCAGKSTLGKYVEDKTGIPYYSFGDIKRRALKNHSDTALRAEQRAHLGEIINPEDAWSILEPHLQGQIFQISGFPISAVELDILKKVHDVLGIVQIRIDERLVRERYFMRATCPVCSRPGTVGETCAKDNALFKVREDACEQDLSRRLKLYDRIEKFLRDSFLTTQYPTLTLDHEIPLGVFQATLLGWIEKTIQGANNEISNHSARHPGKNHWKL